MPHRRIIIDVSRLVGRLMKGRLPTGVDRVILAYVKYYGSRAYAFVRDGRFHVVLPEKLSRTLFHLLENPPADFKVHAWGLIAQGAAASLKPRSISDAFFLNISHSGLEYHGYPDLLAKLKVRPIFMVHDLIPIRHPEFCRPGEQEKHIRRMRTVLEMASGVITNSAATLDELTAFAKTAHLDMPSAVAAYLAPPFGEHSLTMPPVNRPYFVVLGTIEPRKNHMLLLQLWKRLVEEMGAAAPVLVVIGQRGWECENVVDLLERCELLKGNVLELSSCSDAELASWLCHARALLFPSFVEGFGLPLVEALACGTPVIASDLGVFREIAGDVPEYCDPLDGLGWLELIRQYLEPDSARRMQQQERIAHFSTPTWAGHFARVDALLAEIAH